MPTKNPTKAGSHATPFLAFCISIDGINKDHTDAAIITPDAKPNNNFSNLGAILSFSRKTIAAPSVVPIKGIANTNNSDVLIFIVILLSLLPTYLQMC